MSGPVVQHNRQRRPATLANDESKRIAWLLRTFSSGHQHKHVSLGIGDDAAVLLPGTEKWVWTVDACVQGVHFDWSWLSPEDVGWRSLQAAVSDVAAMGARPVAALSSMALPLSAEPSRWRGLARGQKLAAQALECPVIGGNLTRASEVAIHTTVLGLTKRPLLRSGAKPGDELWLVGRVGAAAAGLSVLRVVPDDQRDAAMRFCVNAWRRPKALLQEGRELNGCAHATIDVSDGIASDSAHMGASSGVALVLEAQALVKAAGPSVEKVARVLGNSVLDWVLFGGEDYALLAAGRPRNRPDFATRIGTVERGRGVWLDSIEGKRRLEQTGFEHFKAAR